LATQAYQFVRRDGLEWLECTALSRLPWLIHGFSTRTDHKAGSRPRGFSLGHGASTNSRRIDRNRHRFYRALGAQAFLPASLRQIHSATVWHVVRNPKVSGLAYTPCGSALADTFLEIEPQGDAVITDEPGILLVVRVADCMPILLVDTRRRAAAAVHAGWRGALARIIEKSVGEMERTFGSKPADLTAAIGPSIRSCCYEVGPEVADAFSGAFRNAHKFFQRDAPDETDGNSSMSASLLWLSKSPPGHSPEPKTYLDLAAVAFDQLNRAGVKGSRIHLADFCTASRTDHFFSYRKEGDRAGRMMAVIGIRA
jgi:YfiH family protein